MDHDSDRDSEHSHQVTVTLTDSERQGTTYVSGRKRLLNADDDEDEAGPVFTMASGDSPQASDSAVKKCKTNRHGRIPLTNRAVSMKELDLSDAATERPR